MAQRSCARCHSIGTSLRSLLTQTEDHCPIPGSLVGPRWWTTHPDRQWLSLSLGNSQVEWRWATWNVRPLPAATCFPEMGLWNWHALDPMGSNPPTFEVLFQPRLCERKAPASLSRTWVVRCHVAVDEPSSDQGRLAHPLCAHRRKVDPLTTLAYRVVRWCLIGTLESSSGQATKHRCLRQRGGVVALLNHMWRPQCTRP